MEIHDFGHGDHVYRPIRLFMIALFT